MHELSDLEKAKKNAPFPFISQPLSCIVLALQHKKLQEFGRKLTFVSHDVLFLSCLGHLFAKGEKFRASPQKRMPKLVRSKATSMEIEMHLGTLYWMQKVRIYNNTFIFSDKYTYDQHYLQHCRWYYHNRSDDN